MAAVATRVMARVLEYEIFPADNASDTSGKVLGSSPDYGNTSEMKQAA